MISSGIKPFYRLPNWFRLRICKNPDGQYVSRTEPAFISKKYSWFITAIHPQFQFLNLNTVKTIVHLQVRIIPCHFHFWRCWILQKIEIKYGLVLRLFVLDRVLKFQTINTLNYFFLFPEREDQFCFFFTFLALPWKIMMDFSFDVMGNCLCC